ncbi:putative ribonuclease H protein [Glycine max]|nr:putative ribonuclease H protein [Glycine max]
MENPFNVKALCLFQKELYVCLDSLLQSHSLEVLELEMNNFVIKVPNIVSLSSLTVLELSRINLTSVSSTDSHDLTLNFPVLREYSTKNYTWFNTKEVTFEVPLLEVLLIKHSTSLDISYDAHTIINFCSLILQSHIPDTILFNLDLSTTHIASTTIDPHKFEKEDTPFLSCELRKQFNNNVGCLKFEQLEALAFPQDDIPAFGMLSCLELGKVTSEFLLNLLLKTPSLNTLIIKELLEFDEELSNLDKVPSCFISNLIMVNFGRLNGDQYELSFAKFAMQNAQVLERVSFMPTCFLCIVRRRRRRFKNVKENILPFKRSATFRRIRTVMAFRAYYICSSLFLPKLINQRLSSWNANHLSFAKRVTLVKLVMQALPSHVMQTSFLPRAVCDVVDEKCRSFVWGDSENQQKILIEIG